MTPRAPQDREATRREQEAEAASEELPKAIESARERMESWLTLFGLRRKPEPRSWEGD